MKKVTIFITLTAFFIVGTILLTNISNNSVSLVKQPRLSTEASADWPVYNAETLITEKADLVAFVTVESQQVTKGKNELSLAISKLKVDNVVYGDITSDTIEYHQNVDFIKEGESYLLFLKRVDDGIYVRPDANSISVEQNGTYEVKVKGIEGSYTKDNFTNAFNTLVKQFKAK